jgi:hypothetical protein
MDSCVYHVEFDDGNVYELQEIRLPLTEWQSIGRSRHGHSEGAHGYSVD